MVKKILSCTGLGQQVGNIPLKARELTIGGCQPVEKWLKDRRDRTLSMEEIITDGDG